MRILVTTASRHGWTRHVGDVVADILRAEGHDVTRQVINEKDVVADVLDLAQVDAVVIGGSVYTKTWLSRATTALELALASGTRAYTFAVGVLDLTPDPAGRRWTAPRSAGNAGERVVFGGRITRDGLSVREKSLLAAVRAKDGEYTDWGGVTAWAQGVAADLAHASAPA
ncbi:flavodoxin domain-containing protein [Salana multivorans]